MKHRLAELEYPKLLRIEPSDDVALPQLVDLIHTVNKMAEIAAGGAPNDELDRVKRALVETALLAWRLRKRLDLMSAQMEPRHWRGLDSILKLINSTMQAAGIELKDHTGEPVRGGEAWTIVGWEVVDTLHSPQIIETVRPTTMYNGEFYQAAEVVAGKPAENTADAINA